MRANINWGI